MGYYKIKNITNLLGKRHAKTDTVQVIDITDNFRTTKIDLAVDGEFLIESNFLPISLHKLRTEGLISVLELDKNTYFQQVNQLNNESHQKVTLQASEDKAVEETEEEKTVKSASKVSKKEKI